MKFSILHTHFRRGAGTMAAVILMALAVQAAAQTLPNDSLPDKSLVGRAGISGGYSFENYTADFHGLPGVPSCCPQYRGGSGGGLSAVFHWETPLSDDFFLQFRVGLLRQTGTLRAEQKQIIDNNGTTEGTIGHTIENTITSVIFSPVIGYRVFGVGRVFAGAQGGLIGGANYDQIERLLQPKGVVFENGLLTRNHFSGEISGVRSMQGAVVIGAGAFIPLDKNDYVHLLPEVSYTMGLTDILQQSPWKISGFRVGLGVSYSFWRIPEPIQPPPPPRDTVKITIPVITVIPPLPAVPSALIALDTLDATLTLKTRDKNGVESTGQPLNIDEIIQITTQPLLNYVFFDENSKELPERYVQLQSAETSGYDFRRFNNAGTLATYNNLLNIIGKRLQDNPQAKITLTGTNADIGEEKNNTALSRSRAETVVAYLREIWGIASERITIVARNLPEKPSRSAIEDGANENRRVEIQSSVGEIINPVITYDTLLIAPSLSAVEIYPSVHSSAGIDSWEIVVKQGAAIKRRFAGTGDVPEHLTYDLNGNYDEMPGKSEPLMVEITITDNSKQRVRAAAAPLGVDVNKRKDIRHEQFNLILFDFAQSDITGINRATVQFIKTRIVQGSEIEIEGLTDRVGNPDANARLSLRRAQATAQMLGNTNIKVKGTGISNLYNNDLPEGRFYCRTVKVTVIRPSE